MGVGYGIKTSEQFVQSPHLMTLRHKQYVAVLLLHNTTHHYQALYQISES